MAIGSTLGFAGGAGAPLGFGMRQLPGFTSGTTPNGTGVFFGPDRNLQIGNPPQQQASGGMHTYFGGGMGGGGQIHQQLPATMNRPGGGMGMGTPGASAGGMSIGGWPTGPGGMHTAGPATIQRPPAPPSYGANGNQTPANQPRPQGSSYGGGYDGSVSRPMPAWAQSAIDSMRGGGGGSAPPVLTTGANTAGTTTSMGTSSGGVGASPATSLSPATGGYSRAALGQQLSPQQKLDRYGITPMLGGMDYSAAARNFQQTMPRGLWGM